MGDGEQKRHDLDAYLEDIRVIRQTMLRADDELRVPAWFFFAMAALLLVAGGAHAVLAAELSMGLGRLLVLVWIPTMLLAGVIEVLAWTKTGTRAGIPWMSKAFGRFIATISGIVIAAFALGVVALFSGASTSGVVFLLAATAFLAYSTYSPPASIWLAWLGLGPGVVLLVTGADAPVLSGVAALYVVASFVVLGIAEHRHETTRRRRTDEIANESTERHE